MIYDGVLLLHQSGPCLAMIDFIPASKDVQTFSNAELNSINGVER